MKSRYLATLAALCSTFSLAAHADRDTGWEFGGELLYQNSQDMEFEGGSTVSTDSDLGFALTFGYRLNANLEIQMGLDWQTVDYNAEIAPGTGNPSLGVSIDGEYEAITPRIGINYNFIDGPITPYVTGVIGYSFIDTNIPDGPPQIGCWWDPWYGEVCTAWQETRSADEFMYGLGAGVRWDASDTLSVRFGYEKHWLDFSQAQSGDDFDQFKLGLSFLY
jgi:opacity protein-like surface antigen